MRKLLIILLLLLGGTNFVMSQMRYAFVDTEYILNNIPEYEVAKAELDRLSKIWEEDIREQQAIVDKMYGELKVERVFLSPAMKEKREREIAELELRLSQLEDKYFGNEGELDEKRKELVQPILDNVFNAIKDIAKSENYGAVFDRSQGINVIYFAPKLDKSDKVLYKLGYRKKRK